MMKNLSKKLATGFLVVAMALAAVVVVPTEVEAAADSRDIQWIEVDNSKFVECYTTNNKQAPVYTGADKATGYVFGGWYLAKNGTPIKADTDLSTVTGKVWAKFVPSYMLNVKVQNQLGTTAASSKTDIRVVSAVDSTKYSQVGFTIDPGNDGGAFEVNTSKVFPKMQSSSTEVFPKDVFGAKAQYFISHRLTNINGTMFAKTIFVRPYWVTLDGTRVEGLGKYVHVEDGYSSYISLPVNIYEAQAIAAGIVEIDYDETALTFLKDKSEFGRVFDEMKWAEKNGTVKAVGNVSNISANAATPNDVFVNLRFEQIDPDADLNDSLDFKVVTDSTDFCDRLEAPQSFNLWDIRY